MMDGSVCVLTFLVSVCVSVLLPEAELLWPTHTPPSIHSHTMGQCVRTHTRTMWVNGSEEVLTRRQWKQAWWLRYPSAPARSQPEARSSASVQSDSPLQHNSHSSLSALWVFCVGTLDMRTAGFLEWRRRRRRRNPPHWFTFTLKKSFTFTYFILKTKQTKKPLSSYYSKESIF